MTQEASFRVVGVVAASSLHLAIGWALWSLATAGPPVRSQVDGGGGAAIQIRLIGRDPSVSAQAEASPQEGVRQAQRPLPRLMVGAPRLDRISARAVPGSARATAAAAAAIPDASSQAVALPNAEVLAYRALLEAHLAQYRVYPAAAQTAGAEGVVVLHFVTDRGGRVLDAWIETSSGVSAIDREALQAVARAQPLPAFPSDWPAKVDFSLPVTFKLS